MYIKNLVTHKKKNHFSIRCIKCLILNKIYFFFLLKFQIYIFVQKMILICINYILEKKSSLSHHIMKEKKNKYIYPPFSPTPPSHTTKEIIPWKTKKTPTFLAWKTTPWDSPHPTKKITSPNPTQKTPFEMGGITLVLP